MSRGLIIAAPSSGSGKTVVSLSLLRAARRRGMAVGSLKVGPDYIDPGFHALASGGRCLNLDLWAMSPGLRQAQVRAALEGADVAVCEGVMGLFDGAAGGGGSTADAAAWLGWPVVLVADVKGQAASAAALVRGFHGHRPDVGLAGVVFNRVGGSGHVAVLEESTRELGVAVLGHIPKRPELALADRHLGLVQAAENADLDAWMDGAAQVLEDHADVGRILGLAAEPAPGALANPAEAAPPPFLPPALPPLGQRIAVARDDAFSFLYDHVLDGWRAAGAEIGFFSPLADEGPDAAADAVFLPGGYPELHAGALAANRAFLKGLQDRAAAGAVIYGECGGFMVLGRGLMDRGGASHQMAGLLAVETSMAAHTLHLGYRQISLLSDGPLGSAGARFRGHEFHYSTLIGGGGAEPLFEATDARGQNTAPVGAGGQNTAPAGAGGQNTAPVGARGQNTAPAGAGGQNTAPAGAGGENAQPAGARVGSVMGSYLHLIDRVAD